ncbi:MAG: hypothetical protein R2794_00295 [Chitinophagales bacterium]
MRIKYVMLLCMLCAMSACLQAQYINWNTTDSTFDQWVSLSGSVENGVVFDAGYAHKLPVQKLPLFLDIHLMTLSGEDIGDDMAITAGVQTLLVQHGYWGLSANGGFSLRRNENVFARMWAPGMYAGVAGGYYRTHFFLLAEVGIDASIATHIQHSEAYLGQYPDAVSGWYGPFPGGEWSFGITAGSSIHTLDISLSAGILRNMDITSIPLIPFYGKLGLAYRF